MVTRVTVVRIATILAFAQADVPCSAKFALKTSSEFSITAAATLIAAANLIGPLLTRPVFFFLELPGNNLAHDRVLNCYLDWKYTLAYLTVYGKSHHDYHD